MVWPEFIPIEMRGMSVITALFMIGIVISLVYLYGRISAMKTCLDNTKKVLTEIRISMTKIETWSETHYEDIKEIKEILRGRM